MPVCDIVSVLTDNLSLLSSPPLLHEQGQLWQAKLANAPEYDQWEKLHWETQCTVKKTADGYTRRGKTFWVNKLTGESTWTMPPALEAHPEYAKEVEAKRKRHQQAPPSLEEFVRNAYERYSKNGTMSFAQFWNAFDDELHLTTWLEEDEKKQLAETLDANNDGAVCFDEFVAAVVPFMKDVFNYRGGAECLVIPRSLALTRNYVHTPSLSYLLSKHDSPALNNAPTLLSTIGSHWSPLTKGLSISTGSIESLESQAGFPLKVEVRLCGLAQTATVMELSTTKPCSDAIVNFATHLSG